MNILTNFTTTTSLYLYILLIFNLVINHFNYTITLVACSFKQAIYHAY